LVGQRGATFELVGDESLTMRPHERAAAPLRQMGAAIETTDGHAPVRIEGGELEPISYELPVASAQVKSAVLLAGLFARSGPTTVIEPHPTRDHTERMLQGLGVRISRIARSVSVWPVDRLPALDVEIPGEISSAAPLIAAAVLLNGSELLLQGVNVNPLRSGLLDVLERMGARIAVFNRRNVSGEPVADLEVRSAARPHGSAAAATTPTATTGWRCSARSQGSCRGRACRSRTLKARRYPSPASTTSSTNALKDRASWSRKTDIEFAALN